MNEKLTDPLAQKNLLSNKKCKKNSIPVAKFFHSTRVTRLGDFSPIGRLFTFCILLKITGTAQFLSTFFHGKSDALILTKYRFGYILSDFFTYSSGHSAFHLHFFTMLHSITLCVNGCYFPVSSFSSYFPNQGDQIGQTFAYCAILLFVQFSENDRRRPQNLGYCFPRKTLCINFGNK
jgi:hypothetical protein